MPSLPRHQHDFTDDAFIAEFDLSRPALNAVARAAKAGSADAAKAAVVEHFRVRTSPRWIFDLRDLARDATQQHADRDAPHLWPPQLVTTGDSVIERADAACANRFFITDGYYLEYGPDLNWLDDRTRSLTVPGNAFKCCHWLRCVAQAWALTGETKYVDAWSRLVERWLADFPFMLDDAFTGEQMIFNRAYGDKSMPAGQRLYNWMTCLYTGIPFAPGVATETAFAFIKALWFTAAAYQHFDRSAFDRHNHHIMRTVNVPAAFAVMFPETPRLERLLALAQQNLPRHLHESFTPSGAYVERSSSYAQVTLGMFLAPAVLAMLNGVPLMDSETTARLRDVATYFARLMLPTGNMPPCGDGAANNRAANASFLVLLALVHHDALATQLLRDTGLDRDLPASLRAMLPAPTGTPHDDVAPADVTLAPDWGMAVLRADDPTARAAAAIAIPNGQVATRGHAHDDAMACNLWLAGKPIADTPGDELYIYVHDPEWAGTPEAVYHRSALAKNLVLIHGQPRSSPDAIQAYSDLAAPVVYAQAIDTEGGPGVVARIDHDGATWTRTVERLTDGWCVTDDVAASNNTAAPPHVLQWHLPYGTDFESLDDARWRIAIDGVQIELAVEGNLVGPATWERITRWMRPNLGRANQPAPWRLRVPFRSTSGPVRTIFRIIGA